MAWVDAGKRRALLSLLLPALGFLLLAMSSKVTAGVRHVLLVYPFFIVLAGYGLTRLWRRGRAWPWLLAGLLAYQAVAVVRAAPDYIPFANAFWGGPQRAYWALPFHNTDWGQTPKRIGQSLAANTTGECWVAGVASPLTPTGLRRCHVLPERRAWETPDGDIEPIPATIEGTIFLGVRMTSPRVGGPEYTPLLQASPRMLADAVLVHEGRFALPQLAAVGHALRCDALVRSGQPLLAVEEGRRAVALAGDDPRAWISLGDALAAAGNAAEAGTGAGKAGDGRESGYLCLRRGADGCTGAATRRGSLRRVRRVRKTTRPACAGLAIRRSSRISLLAAAAVGFRPRSTAGRGTG
jgi:hypothetical protein